MAIIIYETCKIPCKESKVRVKSILRDLGTKIPGSFALLNGDAALN